MKNRIIRFEERNKFLLWIYVFIALIIILIAYNIVHIDPYVWLAVLFFFAVAIILKSNIFGFYLIAISIFFADWLAELGLIPAQVSLIPEIIIALYLLKGLPIKSRCMNPRFFLLFIPFLLISVISLIMNFGEDHIVAVLSGLRSILRYVVLFYSIQILPFSDREARRFVKFLFFLLVIQIPVAIVKLFIYGQGESAIGTYGVHGGKYSTILPLIAISFFFGIYYFLHRSGWYLILCAGFVAFGIIGGKRGILFLVPLLIVFLFIKIPKSPSFRQKTISYAALIILLGLGILAPIRYLSTLRDDPLGYAMNYEFATSGDQTIGRMSTTIGVFKLLSSEAKIFLFGYGPGSFSQAFWPEYDGRILRERRSYGFLYGTTGFVWNALEFGYLGALLFLIPIFYLYFINKRFFRSTDDPYWKAISFGLSGAIFSSIVIYFIYSAFYRLDIPSFILLFLGGLIYKKEAEERFLGLKTESPSDSLSTYSPSPDSKVLCPRFPGNYSNGRKKEIH